MSYIGRVVSIKNKIPESILIFNSVLALHSISYIPTKVLNWAQGITYHLENLLPPLISYQRTMYKDLVSKSLPSRQFKLNFLQPIS